MTFQLKKFSKWHKILFFDNSILQRFTLFKREYQLNNF